MIDDVGCSRRHRCPQCGFTMPTGSRSPSCACSYLPLSLNGHDCFTVLTFCTYCFGLYCSHIVSASDHLTQFKVIQNKFNRKWYHMDLCVSKIRQVLSFIHYTIHGAACFQFTHFPCNWENIYTLSYYHHQIVSTNHYPLFRIRSWNNGVRCMSFCIRINKGAVCQWRYFRTTLVTCRIPGI